MLDHILKTARTFEKMHGTPPDVIYINPFHYQELCKHYSRMRFNPPSHTTTPAISGVQTEFIRHRVNYWD